MHMQTMKILRILFLLIPYTAAFTAGQDTIRFTIEPGSEVYYTADVRIALVTTSTVKGDNTHINGTITWIDAGPRPVVNASLVINAAKFDSGNSTRDRDVRGILNVGKYPDIRFELKSLLGLEDKPLQHSSGEYVATGNLTVHGVTKEVRVPVRLHYTDDILNVEGSTAARYTDFGIDPPRVAGFIGRAPDQLRLHVKLIAKRKE